MPCSLDHVIAAGCARTFRQAWYGNPERAAAGTCSGTSDALALPEALRRYHQIALRQAVVHALKSRFYRRHFAQYDTCDVVNMFTSLPFTTPADLAQDWREFLCVSQDAVARIVTLPTSGTTGAPKRIAFSTADLEQTIAFFREGMRQLVQTGDTVLVLLPGAERPSGVTDLLRQAMPQLGARVVTGRPEATPETLRDDLRCAPHCLVAAPGQLVRLLNVVRNHPCATLRGILSSAEPLPPELACELAELGCLVLDHYGLTESGYGGGVECPAHDGYHLRETDIYCEIVDIHTGQPLPEGMEGELVLTTLGREAMPLIRYRTGDVSAFLPGPCRCGSPLRRLAPVRGRFVRETGQILTLKKSSWQHPFPSDSVTT